jgi:hypothetical protein
LPPSPGRKALTEDFQIMIFGLARKLIADSCKRNPACGLKQALPGKNLFLWWCLASSQNPLAIEFVGKCSVYRFLLVSSVFSRSFLLELAVLAHGFASGW